MDVTVEWFVAGNGMWAAESPQVPCTRAYAEDKDRAILQAQVLLLRHLAAHFEAEGRAPAIITFALSATQSNPPAPCDEPDELYDRWLAAEVAEALSDDEEPIPHADAMRLARAALAQS